MKNQITLLKKEKGKKREIKKLEGSLDTFKKREKIIDFDGYMISTKQLDGSMFNAKSEHVFDLHKLKLTKTKPPGK